MSGSIREKQVSTQTPSLSQDPSADEIRDFLRENEPVDRGFFKKVYETENYYLKTPCHPGWLDGCEHQIEAVEGCEIAPETDVKYYDLGGTTLENTSKKHYVEETPVIFQDKGKERFTDIGAADELENTLSEAVELLDRGLENSIVLVDAKLDSFYNFPYGLRNVDIGDKESLYVFPEPQNRSPRQKQGFLHSCGQMYDGFIRNAHINADLDKKWLQSYISNNSRFLNPDKEIELSEKSPKTGLEQQLTPEIV